MKNNRIVVALGRNAFGETFPEQQKNVKNSRSHRRSRRSQI